MICCDKCGVELTIGDFPFCPHGRGANGVIPDDIPGGLEIRHGLVTEDGRPMMFYSKSAIAKEAKRRGLVNKVQHIDGSKHTSRWI